MAGIFINYRREDAPGVAGRLFDRLVSSYPRHEMFMDVDAMKPGLDFVKQVDERMSKCAVVLAIIGPGWLSVVDEKGRRKLDLPRDYVRVELAAALKREIPVIPLLVNGAAMPSGNDLPKELKSLTNRHALELRHSRFSADSEAVIQALGEIVPRRRPWHWTVGAATAIALLGLLAGFVAWRTIDGGPWIPGLTAAKQEVKLGPTTPDMPTGPAAISGDRIALVIGNSKYPDSAPLRTPAGDARLMTSGLSHAGFVVAWGEDLGSDEMRRMLEQFYGRISPHSVVVLFFSGHAITSDRQSYLIPVDAQIWTEPDVARIGFSLETILERINERGPSIQITLLDASRRNPFERRFRSAWAGLAPVNSPTGALVMYSAALSSVENDNANGGSDHSLFVSELLKNVGVPNLTAEDALNRARRAIRSATHSEQIPWVSSQLTEDFTLVPGPDRSR
jgi:hypothetical protein